MEEGRRLFAAPMTFLRGVMSLDAIPPFGLPEICLAGRSNVGKSSLINALCNNSSVARTSNTPGRTQELNFFNLDNRLIVVDMPGYGYAKAPLAMVEKWTRLIGRYLLGRPTLRRAFVLVDARHGLKSSDEEIFTLMDKAAVVYQVVLTKADKLKPTELAAVTETVAAAVRKRPAAYPDIIVTSSEKHIGIAELRAEIARLLHR